MNNILDVTIGQLAREIPGATAVFRAFGLDFCCGGEQRLIDVIQNHKLDSEEVTKQLNELQHSDTHDHGWAEASAAELIEFILSSYHGQHRQQLPELIRLAERVELVHGSRPECPTGLAYLLNELESVLDEHMRKEEQIVFPMLSQRVKEGAQENIELMRAEHKIQGKALDQLNKLTYNITAPVNACNTWRALYVGLQKFHNDLVEHLHLENNILFNKAIA
jgi:regulator of cell morphogenesis and NO signaling